MPYKIEKYLKNLPEGYGGVIDNEYDGIDPRDFTSDDLRKLAYDLPDNPNTSISKLNQGLNERSKYGCTVFGALGQTSYNTAHLTTNGEGIKFCKETIKKGTLDKKKGGNSRVNTGEVQRMWNRDNAEHPVIYGTLLYHDPLVKMLIDKGYMMGISLDITTGYISAREDKKIEEKESLGGGKITGHRPAGIVKGNGKYVLVDNYYGSPRNILEFENWETVNNAFRKGPFRWFCYPILPVKTPEEIEAVKKNSIEMKRKMLVPDAMSVSFDFMPEETQTAYRITAKALRKKYGITKIKEPIYRLVANGLSIIYHKLPEELREPAHKIAEFCRKNY